MPAYKITYTRLDMPEPCKALKFAHNAEDALKLLVTGNKSRGYRLTRSGVSAKIIEIKEL